MKRKDTEIKKVKQKIVSGMFIALLIAATLGTISVFAASSSEVNDYGMNCYCYGANEHFYKSTGYVGSDKSSSVYAQPTYGAVKQAGDHQLGLYQKTWYGGKGVVNKFLPLHINDANKTYSYKIGEAKGSDLYFIVGSYNGEDGAEFYLTGFHGELRN